MRFSYRSDPAQGSTGWALVSHGVGEKLFTVDSTDTVVPQLATTAVRASTNEWTVTLAAGRFFSDGSAVTAADVAASLGRTNADNNAAQSSCGVMTFTATNPTTLSITTTVPTPVMMSVLAEWAFVVYKTLPGDTRIFTGPYAIQTLAADSLSAVPNTYYPNYAEGERLPLLITRYSSGPACTTALSNNEIDLAFNLPSGSASTLNWVDDVTVKSYPVGYQYMMFFNTQRATLSDAAVRRALALAVDRTALSRATHPVGLSDTTINEAVATGAFPANTPWGATSVHPRLATDATAAAAALTTAGWVLDTTTGVRMNNGVPLNVDLVYYTFRSDLVTMAPLIAAQLTAVGANVTVRVDDSGNYMTGAGFDLLLWAQHTLPAGDPNWFLETFFQSQSAPITGSWAAQNFAMHSSTAIDNALAALRNAEGTARATASAAAHNLILNEAPATFLTSPTWHVGVRGRVSTYTPWGSDYYVVKANMGDSLAGASTSTTDTTIPLYIAIGVLALAFVVALISAIAYRSMLKKVEVSKKPADKPADNL